MGAKTHIEWTDSTWNPITGCSVVSAGCTNCYAMKLAGGRLRHEPSRVGLTRESSAGPVWTGEVRFNASLLDQPLRWKRPRKIFVCAHGDLFHESVPDEWIDAVFGAIQECPEHLFQILTKRADRMRRYFEALPQRASRFRGAASTAIRRHEYVDGELSSLHREAFERMSPGPVQVLKPASWPLPNVWLGVSVENQAAADERIPHLLATPAAVRWLSAEPLLGPLDLRWTNYAHRASDETYRQYLERKGSIGEYEALGKIDWVVVGGESGHKARPMHPRWVRALRDQCTAAGVAFLFKQWGSFHVAEVGVDGAITPHIPMAGDSGKMQVCVKGADVFLRPAADTAVETVFSAGNVLALPASKRDTGRLLDGVQHDGYPPVDTAGAA